MMSDRTTAPPVGAPSQAMPPEDTSSPSSVREAVLSQHRAIETILVRIDDALDDVSTDSEGSSIEASLTAHLRDRARELHDEFRDHLAFEERYMLPLVREIDSWGEERVDRILKEHAEQRELLEFLWLRFDSPDTHSQVLVSHIRDFSEILRKDMHHEEHEVLSETLLRDDVVAIDAETG